VISGRESYPLRTSILSLFEAVSLSIQRGIGTCEAVIRGIPARSYQETFDIVPGRTVESETHKGAGVSSELLVLDELTATSPQIKGLDPAHAARTLRGRRYGHSIHLALNEEAQKLSDRVLLIEDGCSKHEFEVYHV